MTITHKGKSLEVEMPPWLLVLVMVIVTALIYLVAIQREGWQITRGIFYGLICAGIGHLLFSAALYRCHKNKILLSGKSGQLTPREKALSTLGYLIWASGFVIFAVMRFYNH